MRVAGASLNFELTKGDEKKYFHIKWNMKES